MATPIETARRLAITQLRFDNRKVDVPWSGAGLGCRWHFIFFLAAAGAIVSRRPHAFTQSPVLGRRRSGLVRSGLQSRLVARVELALRRIPQYSAAASCIGCFADTLRFVPLLMNCVGTFCKLSREDLVVNSLLVVGLSFAAHPIFRGLSGFA